MQNIDEMSIGRIQISRIIRARVDKYRWIQTGDSPDLSFAWSQVISHQATHVSSDWIADEMHVIWRNTARMFRNIFYELRNAKTSEPRSPVNLT